MGKINRLQKKAETPVIRTPEEEFGEYSRHLDSGVANRQDARRIYDFMVSHPRVVLAGERTEQSQRMYWFVKECFETWKTSYSGTSNLAAPKYLVEDLQELERMFPGFAKSKPKSVTNTQ